MTQERVTLLNNVGFVWEAQRGGYKKRNPTKMKNVAKSPEKKSKIGLLQGTSPQPTKASIKVEIDVCSSTDHNHQRPWIAMFKDYLWFLDQGQNPEDVPELKQWATEQRDEYKRQKSKNTTAMFDKFSNLTLDQFNLLKSINFDWNIHLKNEESIVLPVTTDIKVCNNDSKTKRYPYLNDSDVMYHVANCNSDTSDSSSGQVHGLGEKIGIFSSKEQSSSADGGKIEADAAKTLFSLCTKK